MAKKQTITKVFMLLHEYSKIEKQLKNMEIIHTVKTVSEIGEYFVSELFDCIRMKNASNKGYDCVKNKYKIQVKTIRKSKNNTVGYWFPINKISKDLFDVLIILRLNQDFEIINLYLVPVTELNRDNFRKMPDNKYDLTWKNLDKFSINNSKHLLVKYFNKLLYKYLKNK